MKKPTREILKVSLPVAMFLSSGWNVTACL